VTELHQGPRSFKLASTMESVAEVEAAVEKLTQEAGMDEDEAFRVVMASREAAVNAVLHGNNYDPNKQITVSLENNGKSLVIKVADEGEGLDPDKLPDPLAPENLLRGTGRGIFLIRSFLDEVHFRQLHPGTELTLIKHLTPAESKDPDTE
jgi:serine/threonine-protein kinase RsbW